MQREATKRRLTTQLHLSEFENNLANITQFAVHIPHATLRRASQHWLGRAERTNMAVRKSQRRGKPCLVIDIRYTSKDGRPLRFRKDAQAQTMAAARAEEKRYLHNIAQYGSPYEPGAAEENPQSNSDPPEFENANSGKRFVDVVDEFRQTFMVAKLKITTRKGYEAVLSSTLVPKFGELPINQVNGRAAEDLDLELVKRRLKLSTRNNIQIVLRSVLRFATARQYIPGMPRNLPSLKQTGQSVLEIPSDEHIVVLLAKARPSHRCSFTLMADAGLRPNEVRALRRKDVLLQFDNGEPIGGYITIREWLVPRRNTYAQDWPTRSAHLEGTRTGPRSVHERRAGRARRLE